MPGQLGEENTRSLGTHCDKKNGYRIQFWRRPPSFSGIHLTVVKNPVQAEILSKEIAALLRKKAITQLQPNEQHTGFYSNYFLVPKKDGGLRPILDLRHLNAYIKVLPFKMLTTAQILEVIEPSEWFTTLDLKDAYFHVPVHPDHRKFLHFAFQGQAFQFSSRSSPLAFLFLPEYLPE